MTKPNPKPIFELMTELEADAWWNSLDESYKREIADAMWDLDED